MEITIFEQIATIQGSTCSERTPINDDRFGKAEGVAGWSLGRQSETKLGLNNSVLVTHTEPVCCLGY